MTLPERLHLMATIVSHSANLTLAGEGTPYLWTQPEQARRAAPRLVAFAAQLVDAMLEAENITERLCEQCQTPMQIGRPYGFSRNRRFCSSGCKLRTFRQRKKAAAAQEKGIDQ